MSFKRGRDEGEEEDTTMLHLMQNRRAIIPELSLDNAGVQSSAHTEDTGHDNAAILMEKAADIKDLLAERNVYTNYRNTRPSHLLADLDLVLQSEQVGHLAGVEDVVQILYHRLLLDLSPWWRTAEGRMSDQGSSNSGLQQQLG